MQRVNLRTLAAVALVCALLPGCVRLARSVDDLPEGDWTRRLGDAAHAGFIEERVPRRVGIEWDEDVGRGFLVAPIVQQGFIVSAVSGGVVVTADARSGERYWERRFNGSVAGQVLRVGDQVLFATQHRNGRVHALDLIRGRNLWDRRLGSPAAAQPAFADGRLYVATHRDVQAIDMETGQLAWRTRVSTLPPQAPVVSGDELYLAVRDTLLRIQRSDGAIIARTPLPGEPSAPLAIRGDTIVIAMHPGIVAAYAERGGRELWRHSLGAPVIAPPTATPDAVYALTRTAELFRLDARGRTSIVALDGAATGSMTITADGALIGLLDGRLLFVDMNGTTVWEEQLEGSIRAPAVVYDGAIYAGTLEGRLIKLVSE